MNVAIIGVGLLGGSIGYKLRRKNWAKKVLGVGRNAERLEKAVEMNAIDDYTTEINEKLNEIDLFIYCVPVELIPKMLKQAIPFMKKGAIITDVGSTKKDITKEIEKFLPEHLSFVGGHPMAGSEKTGVEALDPFLFENAVYVITRSKNCSEKDVQIVKSMARELDANIIEMDIDLHDLAVATISHVPHIVASSLVNCADKIDSKSKNILALAAGGFRDTTRIASGSPEMWRDICMTNSDKIVEVLDVFQAEIGKFRDVISNAKRDDIYSLFQKGKESRDLLPKKRKGILSQMFEIIVFVPHVPGVIGDVARILGDNGINIIDIEVLHVRENEGGSLRVGLEYNQKEHLAVEVLKEHGFDIKILE